MCSLSKYLFILLRNEPVNENELSHAVIQIFYYHLNFKLVVNELNALSAREIRIFPYQNVKKFILIKKMINIKAYITVCLFFRIK